MVQDAYADVEAAQYAHAFFPASVWAEKDGCFTNTERRVNRVTPVTAPLANSKPDLWIFSELARRWVRPCPRSLCSMPGADCVFNTCFRLPIPMLRQSGCCGQCAIYRNGNAIERSLSIAYGRLLKPTEKEGFEPSMKFNTP